MNELLEQVLTVLRGIWRYRWYALVTSWVICLAAWSYVYRLPDEFKASAKVYVDTQSVLRPLLKGLAVDVNSSSQVRLMTQTLLSRPNVEKVARMTDLDLKATSPEGMDSLVTGLQSKIRLARAGRDNIYAITHSDPDPDFAKRVVQSLLTIFVENTLGESRQDSDTAQRFLNRQISEYEARLEEAENQLKDFKRANVGLMPSSGENYYSRMQASASELATARLALRQAQNRRDSLAGQLSGEEPSFGVVEAPPQVVELDYDFTLPIDSRINALDQRLDDLLLQYTERHPDVIATRYKLEELGRQREEERAEAIAKLRRKQAAAAAAARVETGGNPVLQQLSISVAQEDANIAALEAQVAEYESRVEGLKSAVNTMPAIEAQLASLNRDYNVTRDNYNALVKRRESARISQQAGQTTDDIRFRVIEPPRVPQEPTGPDRPKLMSMSLAAGIAAGLSLAFLLSQLRPTFDSRKSLMEVTRIPVFGVVEAVFSPGRMRRARVALVAFLVLGASLFATYAGLLVMQVTKIGLI